MGEINIGLNRRRFLSGLTAAVTTLAAPGVFAQKLAETPSMGEGPFYPDKLPLDTDNDLLILNDSITPATGRITHLTGTVKTASGEPIRNAFVEIWQTDMTGSYIHTGGRQESGYDKNFQGYGRFLTDVQGRYYFRTIKPISYTLINIYRAAHIHIGISRGGRRVFTTQILVKGDPGNPKDAMIGRLNPAARETLLVDFKPLPGSKLGEYAARFDVNLGRTASEGEDGVLRGVGSPIRANRPGGE
jgi:protocatechuate 3,4-dioxygenase beta subunit